MDRLVFCRKAKELVRNIIRGWYRLEITSDDLLRAADRSSFTWIGVNSREYLPGLSGETLQERLRRMQTSPVPLLMDREKYFFQPVTDRFCCILAEYRLSTDPKSGLILSETQRATFCILLEGEDLRVCHIHASNAVRPGGTARNSAGRTGEYMYELRMRESSARSPALPKDSGQSSTSSPKASATAPSPRRSRSRPAPCATTWPNSAAASARKTAPSSSPPPEDGGNVSGGVEDEK